MNIHMFDSLNFMTLLCFEVIIFIVYLASFEKLAKFLKTDKVLFKVLDGPTS